MTRQRSASITPTYSTDLALLNVYNPTPIVSTLEEAVSALSALEICKNTTFKKRVSLESAQEWSDFLQSCTDSNNNINLEAALKKCYSLAYSMPPSPSFQARTAVQDAPQPLAV